MLKLYLPEPGSDELNRALEGREDLFVSDLTVTEIVSALSRRVRQGSLPQGAARRVQRAIIGRLDDGPYQRVDLTRDVHRQAEDFLLSPTGTPLRAADALHLALAISVRAASVASFDVRLGAAVRTVGLVAYPP